MMDAINVEAKATESLDSLQPGQMMRVHKSIIAMRAKDGAYLVRNAADSHDTSERFDYDSAWCRTVQLLTEVSN
jgi:hypothetical protein